MSLEDMMSQNGYYTTDVEGERHYITSDERGRAVVGPRVRQPRRGWFNRRRRGAAQPESAATVELAGEAEVLEAIEAQHSWSERAKQRWLARFYDRQWHEAVRHCVVDVAFLVCGSALTAAMVKGAWFLVTL